MDNKLLLQRVDHTLLGVTATAENYKTLCDEGITHGVASVCVPPSRVRMCIEHIAKNTKNAEKLLEVCTVIGFPNGYASSEAKAYEAQIAIEHGATEIDMVIDIGSVKDGNYTAVLDDIKKVRAATNNYILKVIIETALLTEEEKIKLCKVVNDSGADFIKTSTGFASSGATFEDVALLRKESAPHVKVKAAGGITSLEDAIKFVELGADRLGTSRIVKILQGMNGSGY